MNKPFLIKILMILNMKDMSKFLSNILQTKNKKLA